MNSPRHSTVVIIGAGPSGLALGHELQARGVNFLILDQGGVGDSWSRMPDQLKLVSPWKTNWLTAKSASRFAPNAQLTRREFLDYLRDFAAEAGLPVVTDCAVSAVERAGQGFLLRTTRGDFAAGLVVNATGYFSNPVTPRIPGDDATRIPRRHYAAVSDAQQMVTLAGRSGQVLIVGHRLSAGQIALDLFDAGLRVAISHRSPIRFGVDDWLWPFVYRTFATAEAVRLKLADGGGGKLDVPMRGRVRKLIRRGAIQTFPAIARFERDTVIFENNAMLAPAAVIYATGFAPTLHHLRSLPLEVRADTGVPLTHGMESLSVPNLFFLGFEMLRNFQSRFLRGIRNDAVALAERIAVRAADLQEVRLPAYEPEVRSPKSEIRKKPEIRRPKSPQSPAPGSFRASDWISRSAAHGARRASEVSRSVERRRGGALANALRLLLYYLRVPVTWIALTLHNSWGILNVLDLIWLRPMHGGLIDERHPFCTGIDPATGELIWHRNVVFKSPRREPWPNTPLTPDADDEIIRKVGDHLRKQVLMAARSETHPHGHAAPMPPGILYIHGGVHFNGVWLLFNDFADAIRHFSDPRFAAEFRRLVREEKREPVTLFRDRDYDRTGFARFVCFMRTIFPWFSNCNGPKKFVLWGNPSPYPAVNTITGNWIRETRALKTEAGRRSVARSAVTQKYFQAGPYFGERERTRWPENLLASLTHQRIALRGERENLYFVDKRKIRRGFRFGPGPILNPLQRLRHWLGSGLNLALNPKGIASVSPGLRGTSYPGSGVQNGLNPEGVEGPVRAARK